LRSRNRVRFSVTDDRYVTDRLTLKVGKAYCREGDPENDTHLRQQMLWARLSELTQRLIVDTAPKGMSFDGKFYQPSCVEARSICLVLYTVIKAFGKITTAVIMAGRDRRANTPFQARHFLDAMRGLFRWALKARLVKIDPTAGVDDPPRPQSDGFAPWSEDDIAAYESRWPVGTRQRVWLDVLIYTGLRRGDAVRFGRQHVRNGVGTIKTEKTGTEVTLSILPVLDATLKAGPCGDLTFVAGENGRPLTKESFGNLFHKACREAGLHDRSAHGLRKAAATRAASAGATVAELEAIFGWQGGTMAA